jgi:decaprenylphospho-beta-D-erythro-pentofuranosid-2-ulose 2-reductase
MPAADRDSPRRLILLGGTSEIALAIVGAIAEHEPVSVALLGRDADRLAKAAEQLRMAGTAGAICIEIDALNRDRHAAALAEAADKLGGVDLVVLAVGVLGERGGLPDDISAALEVLEVNVVGAGSLLMHAAKLLRANGGGTLIVLSSVAGVRVRAANAVYGASKAALDGLAQGIGDALHGDKVRVVVVRPGFVRTRMTRGLRAPPGASTPDAVAKAVTAGLASGAQTIWAPGALRWLMLVMRLLPSSLMRRINL